MSTNLMQKMAFRQIKIVLTLLAFVFLLSCAENKSHNVNPFEGLWKLHVMEQKDSLGGWQEWRDGMNGYILYDATDNMSVHLTVEGYEENGLEFPNFDPEISLEALKHLTGSYVYFAKYEVDPEAETVQHARISHSNPGDWNVVVKRRYTFSGDTLILQPVESQNADLRLKWIKTN